jgi:hypothetical protein
MGSQTGLSGSRGAMIKLSDVKVRPQYRTRVRYRLLVLQYAQAHGPAAADPELIAEAVRSAVGQ